MEFSGPFVPLIKNKAGDRGGATGVNAIIIIKSDSLQADALRGYCESCFPKAAVVACRSPEMAFELFDRAEFDLVVMGLSFPGTDGIELIERIAIGNRRVLVVSGRKDERTLTLLRCSRVAGFFDPQTEDAARIREVLALVAAGQGYISPSLHSTLLEPRTAGLVMLRLTAAELQVFAVIGDGSDDREAAGVLQIGVGTVHSHRVSIMRKLNIRSGRKLVLEAIRLGVVRIGVDGVVQRPAMVGMLPAGARLAAKRVSSVSTV